MDFNYYTNERGFTTVSDAFDQPHDPEQDGVTFGNWLRGYNTEAEGDPDVVNAVRRKIVTDGMAAEEIINTLQRQLANRNTTTTVAVGDDNIATQLREQLTNAQGVIESLQQHLDNMRGQYESARNRHQRDMEYLDEALKEEAERRGWCSEYEQFIDRVNGRLLYLFTPRTHDYMVVRTYTVTATYSVNAANPDDALDVADGEGAAVDTGEGCNGWYISDVSESSTSVDED